MQFESIDEELAGALDCLREVPPPDAERLAGQRLAFVGRVRHTRSPAAGVGPAGRVRRIGWLPYQFTATRRNSMVRVLVALAVMFVGGTSGVIYAANAAVPGDILYGLDRAVESLQLGLTTRPDAASSLLGSLATERLQEADQLAAAGDEENMAVALGEYDNLMLNLDARQAPAAVGQEDDTDTPTTEPSATTVPTGTATAEPSATPVPTDTATTEPSATPVPTDTATTEPSGDVCVGVDPHPVGERLAEEYEVPYEEIMDWFCEGHFGFGEINHALAASEKTGMAPEELLDMKTELGGWGLVWQELGLKGKKDQDAEDDDQEPADGESDASQDAPGASTKDKDKDKDKVQDKVQDKDKIQDKDEVQDKDKEKDKDKDKDKDKSAKKKP